MSREGSLEAPTRHPIAWRDEAFYDEVALDKEMRRVFEVFSRVVVFIVAMFMIIFGWENFLNDMGSFRMPSLIPLGYYTIIVPIAGVFIALFERTP